MDEQNPTIPLSRPIQAHGETLNELTLSEIELGSLDGINLVVDDSGSLRLNLGDIYRLLSAMANIPPSSAKKILVKDALAARDTIAGFFGVSLPTGAS